MLEGNTFEIMSILMAILAGAMSAVVAMFSYWVERERKKRRLRGEERALPGERIQQSILKLSSATQEIDAIIQDIVRDIKQRQTMLEELKASHQTRLSEEAELSKRVETLKGVDLEVAEYFKQINTQTLEEMEEKRLKRDIFMFILGIIATTVISISLLYGMG